MIGIGEGRHAEDSGNETFLDCFTMQGMFCMSHMRTRFVDLSGSVPLQLWPRVEIKPLCVSEVGFLPSAAFTAGFLP